MSTASAIPDAASAVEIPDHTLLRVIGRGSYGEVWLARNIMGTFRAVKIVRRSAFDSDRPYLREFEGIRRCEPVSRAHEGLIDILHMGRHDEEGFFYYVMELADGVDATLEVESYRPATLADRLSRGPRMEAADCLRIAESLAGALAFLHEQGLIHRDVKPSNVMFVGGIAKLGDIGLVAEAGSSRSFVGTEGFVPQEGPGTERADLYALGKVLYEAVTGLDRSKFPLLPADWRNAYDFEQRVELNEIVLRACEGHAERRYASAREMLADIAVVASGKSVRKLRGLERRLRLLKWIAGSVAAAALVAVGASWVWRQQANRERELRLRAGRAESAEREARLDALRNYITAARRNPSPMAVTRALEVVKQAAALRPTAQLRDEAASLLSRPDFAARPELSVALTHPIVALDADTGMMAETPGVTGGTAGPLVINLHKSGAPGALRTLTVAEPPARITALEFFRGASLLLAAGPNGAGEVLDTLSGAVVRAFPPRKPGTSVLQCCGSAPHAVICRAADGGLVYCALPDGEPRATAPLPNWPGRSEPAQRQRLWPSPDGRSVLLIDEQLELPGQTLAVVTGAARLVEVATGRTLWEASGPSAPAAAWSADGTRIAVRAGSRIYSLDAASGKPAAVVPRDIVGRNTEMIFLDSRDTLAWFTTAGVGLCDLARSEVFGRPAIIPPWSYGQRNRLLLGRTEVVEWHPSLVMRTFHPPPAGGPESPVFVTISPDDAWLIVGNTESFTFWRITDSESTEPVSTWPAAGAADVLFSNKGRTAHFIAGDGWYEAPWTGRPLDALPEMRRYGPPDHQQNEFASVSADGKWLAYGGFGIAVAQHGGTAARSFPAKQCVHPLSLSPDGNWLAVGAQKAPGLNIYDLTREGNESAHLVSTATGTSPVFSPNGEWLACSDVKETLILETGTWNVIHRFPRISANLLGQISFSADSRLMSVKDTWSSCTIIETAKWSPVHRLESPLEEIFISSILSPGGRWLAALGARREIYVWDLHALAGELEKLGLSEGSLPLP